MYIMGNVYGIVWNSLLIQKQAATSWYKKYYLLANAEILQSLIINPRDVDAAKNYDDMRMVK